MAWLTFFPPSKTLYKGLPNTIFSILLLFFLISPNPNSTFFYYSVKIYRSKKNNKEFNIIILLYNFLKSLNNFRLENRHGVKMRYSRYFLRGRKTNYAKEPLLAGVFHLLERPYARESRYARARLPSLLGA